MVVAARPDELLPDDGPLLAGRYTVGEPIGRGRSTVHRGEDRRLRRKVAIKEVRLAEGQEGAERVRRRAMREAQAAARLNNPHVVTVYDVVEEGSSIWLVMELVDAPSLAQVVDDGGPLTHARAARIGLAVLDALQDAHAVGIVHRDVKPANVLVSDDDHAKLADFGVASIRDETGVTAVGSIIGSPAYMAPEQAMAAKVGPATDLWSLGATLYYAVEGQAPFKADSPLATATAVVSGKPRPQQNHGSLSSLIARLLDKDPERRSSAEHVHALLSAATTATSPAGSDDQPTSATLVAPAVPQPDPAGSNEAEPPAETSRHPLAAGGQPAGSDEPTVPRRRLGAEDDQLLTPAAARRPTSTSSTRPAGTDAAAAVAASLAAAARSVTGTRSRRPLLLAAAVAVALVLAVAGVWALVADDGEPQTDRVAQGGQSSGGTATSAPGAGEAGSTTPTTAASPTTSAGRSSGPGGRAATTAPPAAAADGQVPDGWVPYRDPTAGYTIAHPPGWQVVAAGGPRIDIRDPATGSYLRIDWTATPRDDPVADWRQQAEGFAGRHPGYQEVRIEAYPYRDYVAAIWEFRYQAGGAQLHAANLGFVTGGRGYALLFQTREERWASSQDVYAAFRASFRPAP